MAIHNFYMFSTSTVHIHRTPRPRSPSPSTLSALSTSPPRGRKRFRSASVDITSETPLGPLNFASQASDLHGRLETEYPDVPNWTNMVHLRAYLHANVSLQTPTAMPENLDSFVCSVTMYQDSHDIDREEILNNDAVRDYAAWYEQHHDVFDYQYNKKIVDAFDVKSLELKSPFIFASWKWHLEREQEGRARDETPFFQLLDRVIAQEAADRAELQVTNEGDEQGGKNAAEGVRDKQTGEEITTEGGAYGGAQQPVDGVENQGAQQAVDWGQGDQKEQQAVGEGPRTRRGRRTALGSAAPSQDFTSLSKPWRSSPGQRKPR